MGKKSFLIYENWAILFSDLPDEKAGKLIKAICNHELDREYEIDDESVKAIFSMFAITLNENREKYNEKCKKLAENGSKGGKQKVANATNDLANAKQMVANGKQMVAIAKNDVANGSKWVANCSDNDNDNVNVNNNINNIYATATANATIRQAKTKRVIELYNLHCPSLPKVLRLTEKRMKLIDVILKDYTEENLITVFDKAENSRLLREGTDKWVGADFDWLLNPQNFIKTLEGKYDRDYSQKNANAGIQKSQYDFDALRKMIDGG